MRKIFQININKSWHLLLMWHLQIKTECLENFAKSPTLALYDPNKSRDRRRFDIPFLTTDWSLYPR